MQASVVPVLFCRHADIISTFRLHCGKLKNFLQASRFGSFDFVPFIVTHYSHQNAHGKVCAAQYILSQVHLIQM